jgi:two-component system, OmpR family, sensor histidine kinase QseC
MTRRPPTLFRRLILLTLPVECLVLALFVVWLIRGDERRERAAFDERLRLQSQAVLRGVRLDLAGRMRFDADLNARVLGADTQGCLLDGRGVVLWESPAGWFGASGLKGFFQEDLEVVHSLQVEGRWTRVIQTSRSVRRAQDEDEATGPLVELVLAKPLSALDAENLALRQKAVAVGILLVALTTLLLWLAIRTGLRPIRQVMRRLSEVPGPGGQERLDEDLVPTELRPLAREINALLDRLWALVQLERRFTAEAAHELRTPLTLVKSTLQTALLTSRSVEDHAGALGEALEDLQRLEHTAEELLVLARADALFGSREKAFEEIALQDLLRATAERFDSAAEARDLKLVLVLQPVAVRGDRQALERLFLNLVDNAVKYTGVGGSITLRCMPSADGAVAVVEDTGPSIPKAERAHLFEQFFRGSSGRAAATPGGGLGLAIALAMARLHGADLAYEPCVPDGNRFVVRFPRAGSGEPGAVSG